MEKGLFPPSNGSVLSSVLFKVFCCDHTYITIRVPVVASVSEVISAVADKLGSAEDLLLVGLSSAGGESLLPVNSWIDLKKHFSLFLSCMNFYLHTFCQTEKVVFKPSDISVFSTLDVNGRLFVCRRDQLDSLVVNFSQRLHHKSIQLYARLHTLNYHNYVTIALSKKQLEQLLKSEKLHLVPLISYYQSVPKS